jgi:hypothetical protein
MAASVTDSGKPSTQGGHFQIDFALGERAAIAASKAAAARGEFATDE